MVLAIRFIYSLISTFRHTSSCLDLGALKFLSSHMSSAPSLYIILSFLFLPSELMAREAIILFCSVTLYSSSVSTLERMCSYALRLFKTSPSLPLAVKIKKWVIGYRNPDHLALIPVTDRQGTSASCSYARFFSSLSVP